MNRVGFLHKRVSPDGDTFTFTEVDAGTVEDESIWQRVVADPENAIVGTWSGALPWGHGHAPSP